MKSEPWLAAKFEIKHSIGYEIPPSKLSKDPFNCHAFCPVSVEMRGIVLLSMELGLDTERSSEFENSEEFAIKRTANLSSYLL